MHELTAGREQALVIARRETRRLNLLSASGKRRLTEVGGTEETGTDDDDAVLGTSRVVSAREESHRNSKRVGAAPLCRSCPSDLKA